MIDKIKLLFGASKSAQPLEFIPSTITIFVGPNNSGKSQALREIEFSIGPYHESQKYLIIDNVKLGELSHEEINSEINKSLVNSDPANSWISLQKVTNKINNPSPVNFDKVSLIAQAQSINSDRQVYRKFLQLHTTKLDGTNRLNLLNESSAGDLLQPPKNILSLIFKDNELRKRIRKIVFDAFEKYFVIDPTKLSILRVRLSESEPKSEETERGIHEESIYFHQKAKEITNSSDGVKAYCGIITSLMAENNLVLLIDEPEAFLHPGLSYKLGKEIGRYTSNTNKRFIAATHSSNFLMGCILSGAETNIIRLTHSNTISTSRLLPNEDILKLIRNPLLRSTGVLNGLFYDSVIVVEADTDRAFYQEINERLLDANDERGIPNCLFVNAQNKQTVWDIVKPLRKLGIPAGGIVDIDVIKDGGSEFSKLMSSCFIPESMHSPLNSMRQQAVFSFKQTEKNMKREGGINLLDNGEKESCISFFKLVNEYGIFIVPNGELESWLSDSVKASGHGPGWLLKVFEQMGEDPSNPSYIKPCEGDVWDFIGQIKNWTVNQERKGIPSE